MLAIMADHVPSGVGAALGREAGGNSLDNTIRFLDLVETEWVLGDISIIAAARGFAHGAIRLFSEDGRLLATASQSLIVRFWDPSRARRKRSATRPSAPTSICDAPALARGAFALPPKPPPAMEPLSSRRGERMRELILFRHAKTEANNAGGDRARELTEGGRSAAADTAAALAADGVISRSGAGLHRHAHAPDLGDRPRGLPQGAGRRAG